MKGFTLVELMVVIAIVAILVAIAFPSFQGTLRSNRVATASNELLSTISLARSEAIRSRGGAGICASTAGLTCDGASWNAGWLVWTDTSGNGLLDLSERVVRYVPARHQLAITLNAGGNVIRFDNRGRNLGNARTITLTPTTCPSAEQSVRTVSVSITGQAKMAKGACS